MLQVPLLGQNRNLEKCIWLKNPQFVKKIIIIKYYSLYCSVVWFQKQETDQTHNLTFPLKNTSLFGGQCHDFADCYGFEPEKFTAEKKILSRLSRMHGSSLS